MASGSQLDPLSRHQKIKTMIGQLAAAVQRGREPALSEAKTRARGGATRSLGAGPCGVDWAPATRMRPGVAAVAAVREVDAMAGSAWVSKVSATGQQARGRAGRVGCDLASWMAEASTRRWLMARGEGFAECGRPAERG